MVRTVVVAVHVAEERRSRHRVVEGRVENPPGSLVRRRDLHFRQFGIPFRIGGFYRGVEIPAGKLRREIRLGTLDTHGRKGYFQQHLFAVSRCERRPGIFVPDGFELRKGFREFSHKINPLVVGPARRVAVTRNTVVTLFLQMRLRRLVPATAVLQIEDYGRGVRRREGIAMQPHTFRGGHFGRDAVPCQRHRVVARLRDLFCPIGVGPHPRSRVFLLPAGIGHLARNGHDGDVEQVPDARTGKVRM